MTKAIVTYTVDEAHPEVIEAVKDSPNGKLSGVIKDQNMLAYLIAEKAIEVKSISVFND